MTLCARLVRWVDGVNLILLDLFRLAGQSPWGTRWAVTLGRLGLFRIVRSREDRHEVACKFGPFFGPLAEKGFGEVGWGVHEFGATCG